MQARTDAARRADHRGEDDDAGDAAGGVEHVQEAAEDLLQEAAAPAEGPMEMRIVSMPDRTTESSIERNAKGQIVNSSQIEKDA